MRKFKINVNGNWYEIEIGDLEEQPISVWVDGELYKVELAHEIQETEVVERVRAEPAVMVSEPALETRGPMVAEGEVIAPMPGKILAIHVTMGERVQYQDVLCTLEAMKMENEIMAPAGGVVKEIRVAEGQEVMYGDVLFVIG
jgi:biotin carboxyl carrier protein